MLRVVAHKNAGAARQYYSEGLKREDYYSEGQEVVGKWYGKAASLLGLPENVSPEAFAALVENRHPVTGERLTPRTKIDRTVGYDLNFHSPKGLSVLHALTGDKEILKAFRLSVLETMQEIEAHADTRVRRGGADKLRTTGNLVWAEFIHFTARPVGGIPDPHLHIHCFVQNVTFDAVENRWKAAMFKQIKTDAPYFQAAFHARLAARIEKLGYAVSRTKQGWDVAGIPRSLIDKFSRRSAQIDEIAAAKGITDPRVKDGLGALTREGKRRGLNKADLLAAWDARLNSGDRAAIAKVQAKGAVPASKSVSTREAVDYAIEKLFAKDSVAQQNRLVAEALQVGVGSVTPTDIWKELAKREMIIRKIGDQVLCAPLDVLVEEVSLLNFVRMGRGNFAPLGKRDFALSNTRLKPGQRAAVTHALRSRDQVIAIRGAAGVGKTTLMKEVVAQIEASGRRVFAFAPSADASRGTLRDEGFSGAQTIAHLLQNKELQRRIRGQVIWIDEAGLTGMQDLWRIMQIAGSSTRVILTGDSAQHSPVPRGDPFRLLQRYTGLKIAQVTEIIRQEGETYRMAVAALSKGDIQTGFRHLDDLGAILEIKDDGARYKQLAADYLALSRKSPPLVVSPTHAESAKVTEAIRNARRDAGQLKNERSFAQYHNLQWELADRKRAENYSPGLLVRFHQNAKGILRGELFRVTGHNEKGGVLATGADGRTVTLPLAHASRFLVFEEREIQIGKGDRIRITNNGNSSDGKRLNNGAGFEVKGFTKEGGITLSNGAVLDKNHGHFTHGYCQTSHSSQSKTKRDVLVAQSAESFVASSREQFYVSTSRGQSSIRIYTDDRCGLQQAVGNSSIRTSAIELAQLGKRDLAAMTEGLNSQQWSQVIRSRRAEGVTHSHVEALFKERRQQAMDRPEQMSWKQYVQMRRDNAGPDGKSRSKGQPTDPSKKGDTQNKGRSFLRPTELRDATKEKINEHHAKKTAAPADSNSKTKPPTEGIKPAKNVATRKDQLINAYQNSVQHLAKLANRLKNRTTKLDKPADKGQENEPAAQRRKPRSTIAQVADHAAKAKEAAQKTPPKTKVQVQQPPIRRK